MARERTAKQIIGSVKRSINARTERNGGTHLSSLREAVKATPSRYAALAALGMTTEEGFYLPERKLTADQCEAVIQCCAWAEAWGRTCKEYAVTFGVKGYADLAENTEEATELELA